MSFFQKIIERIQDDSTFYFNIYYPSEKSIKIYDAATWINQENDRVYLCTHQFHVQNTYEDFYEVKEFLVPYTYRKILEIPENTTWHKVIYEIQEDNSN